MAIWARCCDALLGVWLICSPAVLAVPASRAAIRWFDWVAGLLIVAVACVSLRTPGRSIHLLGLAVAGVLVTLGWWHRSPGDAAHENHVLIGLVLAITTIVPTDATAPPPGWRADGLGPGEGRREAR